MTAGKVTLCGAVLISNSDGLVIKCTLTLLDLSILRLREDMLTLNTQHNSYIVMRNAQHN